MEIDPLTSQGQGYRYFGLPHPSIPRLLEASYKDMESFTYSAYHDLRSPLIAILGFSRVLLEDHGKKFDDEVKELLGIIMKNAAKMEQLIRDLLRFSRISSKDVEMNDDEIDMGALLEEVYEELSPVMGERKIDLEVRPLLPSKGDKSMLKQVLLNLLSNAVKYTSPVESARIEVGCVKQGSEKVYYVKDNGVGFDMQYSDKLFGLFSRLHGTNEFEGTGIGLAIIKRIIEKHGGRVWAKSSLNEGATFYFPLPLTETC
jgi:light-regulated signal transduction histidine kinase (bacteriophytochrome)